MNVHSQASGGECIASNDRQHCAWNSVCLRQTFLFCSLSLAPSEPLLCKFADGGQKKRLSHNKFAQNGRGWGRDGDSRLVSGAQDGMSGLMGTNP